MVGELPCHGTHGKIAALTIDFVLKNHFGQEIHSVNLEQDFRQQIFPNHARFAFGQSFFPNPNTVQQVPYLLLLEPRIAQT